MANYTNPNNPFDAMRAANIKLRKLFKVSFILENGIAMETTDQIKAAPINK